MWLWANRCGLVSDAGKSDHYCVVIDADGKRLLRDGWLTMKRRCWNWIDASTRAG